MSPPHQRCCSNLLGTTTLGERESGTGKLTKAVTAYREALKEWMTVL